VPTAFAMTADIMRKAVRTMTNSPLILFVDGHVDDREYFTHRLGLSFPDFQIVHAAAGRSCLTFCERQSVDCVVLEIALPDMSGFEVLLKLIPRAQSPEIAVIVLTRLSNTYLLEAAIRNGAQAALHKGVTSADVLDKAILKALSTVPTNVRRPFSSQRSQPIRNLDTSTRLA
jgi:DNA-binding NarL/FixJ family response regulator